MSCKLTRQAYEKLIAEDIEAVEQSNIDKLEKMHIIDVLRHSVQCYYKSATEVNANVPQGWDGEKEPISALKVQVLDCLFWFNRDGSPCDGPRFREEFQKLRELIGYDKDVVHDWSYRKKEDPPQFKAGDWVVCVASYKWQGQCGRVKSATGGTIGVEFPIGFRRQNSHEVRHATPAEIAEVEPKCRFCNKPATCHGTYEGDTGYACDDCCGHGCEDGHCEPIQTWRLAEGQG